MKLEGDHENRIMGVGQQNTGDMKMETSERYVWKRVRKGQEDEREERWRTDTKCCLKIRRARTSKLGQQVKGLTM